jgi:uncharacterized protein YcbX
MHVTRIGLTPLKGTRHAGPASLDLTLDGPVGDRLFCLVDRSRGRVLRTVEHPAMLATSARWADGVLRTDLPHRSVEAVPEQGGERLRVDYWGRPAEVELVDGPWAAAYSEHLGRPVDLARARRAGEVVFGGSVSLVTSSSVERVQREVGAGPGGDRLDHPADDRSGDRFGDRFRATLTVDTSGQPPFVEDTWVGRRLRVGTAEVEVRGRLPRCAVVDLDPGSGGRRTPVLATLAGYRRVGTEILFGVDATVVRPGRIDLDAVVERG